MFIPETNHYTMETLSNELENAPEFIPCSEDDVICSKCSIICNNENSLTVTSERVRRNRGTRTWQTCFKEIVPSKMILTNSEILNSGCSVTPKNEFRSNEDNKTESTIVTFNLKPVVHTMIKWDYAYRAARKGPWEQMARDRFRFNGRISSYHLILDPILQVDHRVRIWTERFS
ncbi:hypothetical protein M0804_012069 [Polistes exclamans]|nr:hypothetical protein M0804_012069 [Polistes exclamans]